MLLVATVWKATADLYLMREHLFDRFLLFLLSYRSVEVFKLFQLYGKQNRNFTANDVGFVGNNEKEKFVEEGRFVVGKVYARVPASAQRSVDGDENNNNDDDDNEDELILDERDNVADAQTKVLSKSLVQGSALGNFVIFIVRHLVLIDRYWISVEVLTKYRDQIVRESGVQVAYIESKLVYPPRDNFDNFLIIPISCAFCIAILIFNLVCQHKRYLEFCPYVYVFACLFVYVFTIL